MDGSPENNWSWDSAMRDREKIIQEDLCIVTRQDGENSDYCPPHWAFEPAELYKNNQPGQSLQDLADLVRYNILNYPNVQSYPLISYISIGFHTFLCILIRFFLDLSESLRKFEKVFKGLRKSTKYNN